MELCGHGTCYHVLRVVYVIHLTAAGGTTSVDILPRFEPPDVEVGGGGLLAPMPGIVLDGRVAPGDAVLKGQTLVVLEAMKMEHHMDAPVAGIVAEVRVAQGEQVDTGAVLIVFEQDQDQPSEIDHE